FLQLVNIGLGVTVDPPDASLRLVVYGNDQAGPSDVRAIAPETLRLRAERRPLGYGRVYLIVAAATGGAGATPSDVCTFVVPRAPPLDSLLAVDAQATAAELWYRATQTAPPGFRLLGEGPAGPGGAPARAAGPAPDGLAVDGLGPAPVRPVAPLTAVALSP